MRVDAVVRTRKIGHFFPGGTVDGFDVWLEFQARDANGPVLAWSGSVDDNGRGPVDNRRALLSLVPDRCRGQPDQQAQRLAGAQHVLCPPDPARRGRHRPLPASISRATPRARSPSRRSLNYRKFADYYTQVLVRRRRRSPGPRGISLRQPRVHASIPRQRPRRMPDHHAGVAPTSRPCRSARPTWQPVVRKQDRERWNDWGIGLLLQGDLKGAEYAFQRVTEAEPEYADGWLNVARALIQEGETEAARAVLEKALALIAKLAPRPLLPGA